MSQFISLVSVENRRAFTGRSFWLSIGCGVVLVIWHTVSRVVPRMYLNEDPLEGAYPFSLHQLWLGMDSISSATAIWLLLVSLLAAMPHAASLFDDRRTGYESHVATRATRINYYLAKYVAVSVSGGVAAAAPLVLSFVVTALFLPTLPPSPITGTFHLWASSIGGDLYYAHPFLYSLGSVITVFFWGGAIAGLALLCGFFLSIRVVVLVFPLLLVFLIDFVFTSVDPGLVLGRYSPLSFFQPSQRFLGMRLSIVVVEWIAVVGVTTLILWFRARQDEAV